LSAAALAFAALVGMEVRSAELEGALHTRLPQSVSTVIAREGIGLNVP
jgi:hypothetical protein